MTRTASAEQGIGDALRIVGRALALERAVAVFVTADGLRAALWCAAAGEDVTGRAAADAHARASYAFLAGQEAPRGEQARGPAPAQRIVLPLVVERRVLGALQLDGAGLDEDDLAYGNAVAQQLALALLRVPAAPAQLACELLEQRRRSPAGLMTLSRDGHILELNDVAAHLLDVDGSGIGAPLLAFLVPGSSSAVGAHIDQCLASDGRRPFELEVKPASQRSRRLLLASRRHPARGTAGLLTAAHDVSARARLQETLDLVTAASAALTDVAPTTVLVTLCRALVPALADLCVADLVVPGPRLARRAVVRHVDADRGRRFERMEARWGPLPNVAFASLNALRTGRVTRTPDVDARYMQLAAVDADHLTALVGLALRSWLVVPLTDPRHQGPLGVLRLATAGTRRAFDDDDVGPAERLRALGSTALANANARAMAPQRRDRA